LVGLSLANGYGKKQRKDLTQKSQREEHRVRGELCGRKELRVFVWEREERKDGTEKKGGKKRGKKYGKKKGGGINPALH
jgi:hypothetical protein